MFEKIYNKNNKRVKTRWIMVRMIKDCWTHANRLVTKGTYGMIEFSWKYVKEWYDSSRFHVLFAQLGICFRCEYYDDDFVEELFGTYEMLTPNETVDLVLFINGFKRNEK